MKFSEVTGHKKTIELLCEMVDKDQLPHAVLLSGAPGSGKMKIALALAQYVHCGARAHYDSCGKCRSCNLHEVLNNPDMHFVYPILKRKKEGKEVSKDYLREWKEFLKEDPYVSPLKWSEKIDAGNSQPIIYASEAADLIRVASLSAYNENKKIFIIWCPEKMNSEAANKLLKIIEEPYEDTLFIFVSDNPSQILPTIFSRLTQIKVSRLSNEEVSRELTRRGIDEEQSIEIARLSEGDLGKALEMSRIAGEEDEFNTQFMEIMRMAYSRNLVRLKEISENIAGFGREKNRRFLNYCSRMIRENYIYNFSVSSLNLLRAKEESFSRKFSPFINSRNVEKLMEEIGKAETDISKNANAKIVMFHLMLLIMMEIRK